MSAALTLFKELPLDGAVITGDVLFTQKEICRHNRDRRGHYLSAVKDNPRQLPAPMASANGQRQWKDKIAEAFCGLPPKACPTTPCRLIVHAPKPAKRRTAASKSARARSDRKSSCLSMDQARRPSRASNFIAARPDATASKSPLWPPVCRQNLQQLLAALQASEDGDFFHVLAETTLNRLMDFDVDNAAGATRHERSPERATYPNGYRDRVLETRVGALDLEIPKLRSGPSYYPGFILEPRRLMDFER